jgi:antitoxin ParD1/3/4
MMVELKPEDEALVQERLRTGAFANVEEVIHYALQALEQDEVWLQENKDKIHEKIGEGIAALDRGEGIPGADSRSRLQDRKATWLKQRS